MTAHEQPWLGSLKLCGRRQHGGSCLGTPSCRRPACEATCGVSSTCTPTLRPDASLQPQGKLQMGTGPAAQPAPTSAASPDFCLWASTEEADTDGRTADICVRDCNGVRLHRWRLTDVPAQPHSELWCWDSQSRLLAGVCHSPWQAGAGAQPEPRGPSKLVMADLQSGLCAVHAVTGSRRGPSLWLLGWSVRGELLDYCSALHGASEYRVFSSDGGLVASMDAPYSRVVSWAPDGKVVAILIPDVALHLWAVHDRCNVLTRYFERDSCPIRLQWSPASDRILLTSLDGHCRLYHPNGQQRRLYGSQGRRHLQWGPALGRCIVHPVSRLLSAGRVRIDLRICLAPATGRETLECCQVVTPTQHNLRLIADTLCLSHDGAHCALTAAYSGSDAQLAIVCVSSGQLQLLAVCCQDVRRLTWSSRDDALLVDTRTLVRGA